LRGTPGATMTGLGSKGMMRYGAAIVGRVVVFHHGNTGRQGHCGGVGHGIKTPLQITAGELQEYGLIGFGSGIYGARHHKLLLDLADRMPRAGNGNAFLFSTFGAPEEYAAEGCIAQNPLRLREKLVSKGSCSKAIEYAKRFAGKRAGKRHGLPARAFVQACRSLEAKRFFVVECTKLLSYAWGRGFMHSEKIKNKNIVFVHKTPEWDLNIHLIMGGRYNYVIDTGLGAFSVAPVKEYLKDNGNPIIVINTHHHWTISGRTRRLTAAL
jgi:hypothetical protein